MKKVVLAGLLGVLVSSCATIMNGDMVNVPIHTTPEGAKLTVNGTTYSSPATVMVPRGEGDFTLKIEKEGYESVAIVLTESIDGWLWGNVLFGGIIGLAVDFATGKAYDVEPELVSLNLANKTTTKLKDGTLQVVLVDIRDLSQKEANIIIESSHNN